MADCFFCGDFVGEENGDGGVKGRSVGGKDICEQCLGELKHWLNGSLPRSPGMREKKIVDGDEEVDDSGDDLGSDSNASVETSVDEDASNGGDEEDPFSSGAKI